MTRAEKIRLQAATIEAREAYAKLCFCCCDEHTKAYFGDLRDAIKALTELCKDSKPTR